ncbi:MAG TPA: PAS domain-containing protein, partial [Elusimicrobiales bacterium]|nr:PAS domain-containing protein [Elusimicrobiales bacterium]
LQLRRQVARATSNLAERNRQLEGSQEIVRRSEERLRVTLHSIGDAVIAVDTQGRVQLMNKVAQDLTGWPEKEALGLPLNEIFHIFNGRTMEPCENPVGKVLKSGAVVELANHTVLRNHSGKEYSIADSGAPIFNRDGSIGGVILVFRDVTADHKMRDELLLRNAAIESARHAVMITDMNSEVTYANKAMLEMFGLPTVEAFIAAPTDKLI